MNLGVLGAGAIGAYVSLQLYAGNFGLSDLKLTLVGRRALNSDVEAAGHKLTVKNLAGKKWTFPQSETLVVTDDPGLLRECEVILVAVKSSHTQEAMKGLLEKIGSEGPPKTIVSLQNGLRNPEIIRNEINAVGAGSHFTVLAGMVEFNVVWEEHATFVQSTSGSIYVQDRGAAQSFGKLLKKGGIPVSIQEDITPYQLGKILINLNNAVNALSGVPVYQMLKDGGHRKVVAMCIEEGLEVFKQTGMSVKSDKVPIKLTPKLFRLPDCIFRLIMPFFVKINPAAKASMLQDVEKGNDTEIDYLNGEILRIAEHRNLPEPRVNRIITDLIREVEANKKGSPMMDGATLLMKVQRGTKQISSM